MALKGKMKSDSIYTFRHITVEEILTKIGNHNMTKLSQGKMFRRKLSNKIWISLCLLYVGILIIIAQKMKFTFSSNT